MRTVRFAIVSAALIFTALNIVSCRSSKQTSSRSDYSSTTISASDSAFSDLRFSRLSREASINFDDLDVWILPLACDSDCPAHDLPTGSGYAVHLTASRAAISHKQQEIDSVESAAAISSSLNSRARFSSSAESKATTAPPSISGAIPLLVLTIILLITIRRAVRG